RIFPPYWLFLGILALLTVAATWGGWYDLLTQGDCRIPPPESLDGPQWLGNLTLTEAWRIHVLPEPQRRYFFGPAWTLCYEEQFYAVCGLVLWLAPRRFWQGMIVISLLSLVPASLGLQASTFADVEGWFCDGRWLVFAAGIVVYF